MNFKSLKEGIAPAVQDLKGLDQKASEKTKGGSPKSITRKAPLRNKLVEGKPGRFAKSHESLALSKPERITRTSQNYRGSMLRGASYKPFNKKFVNYKGAYKGRAVTTENVPAKFARSVDFSIEVPAPCSELETMQEDDVFSKTKQIMIARFADDLRSGWERKRFASSISKSVSVEIVDPSACAGNVHSYRITRVLKQPALQGGREPQLQSARVKSTTLFPSQLFRIKKRILRYITLAKRARLHLSRPEKPHKVGDVARSYWQDKEVRTKWVESAKLWHAKARTSEAALVVQEERAEEASWLQAKIQARKRFASKPRRITQRMLSLPISQQSLLRRMQSDFVRTMPTFYLKRAALFFATFSITNVSVTRRVPKFPALLKALPGIKANIIATRTLRALELQTQAKTTEDPLTWLKTAAPIDLEIQRLSAEAQQERFKKETWIQKKSMRAIQRALLPRLTHALPSMLSPEFAKLATLVKEHWKVLVATQLQDRARVCEQVVQAQAMSTTATTHVDEETKDLEHAQDKIDRLWKARRRAALVRYSAARLILKKSNTATADFVASFPPGQLKAHIARIRAVKFPIFKTVATAVLPPTPRLGGLFASTSAGVSSVSTPSRAAAFPPCALVKIQTIPAGTLNLPGRSKPDYPHAPDAAQLQIKANPVPQKDSISVSAKLRNYDNHPYAYNQFSKLTNRTNVYEACGQISINFHGEIQTRTRKKTQPVHAKAAALAADKAPATSPSLSAHSSTSTPFLASVAGGVSYLAKNDCRLLKSIFGRAALSIYAAPTRQKNIKFVSKTSKSTLSKKFVQSAIIKKNKALTNVTYATAKPLKKSSFASAASRSFSTYFVATPTSAFVIESERAILTRYQRVTSRAVRQARLRPQLHAARLRLARAMAKKTRRACRAARQTKLHTLAVRNLARQHLLAKRTKTSRRRNFQQKLARHPARVILRAKIKLESAFYRQLTSRRETLRHELHRLIQRSTNFKTPAANLVAGPNNTAATGAKTKKSLSRCLLQLKIRCARQAVRLDMLRTSCMSLSIKSRESSTLKLRQKQRTIRLAHQALIRNVKKERRFRYSGIVWPTYYTPKLLHPSLTANFKASFNRKKGRTRVFFRTRPANFSNSAWTRALIKKARAEKRLLKQHLPVYALNFNLRPRVWHSPRNPDGTPVAKVWLDEAQKVARKRLNVERFLTKKEYEYQAAHEKDPAKAAIARRMLTDPELLPKKYPSSEYRELEVIVGLPATLGYARLNRVYRSSMGTNRWWRPTPVATPMYHPMSLVTSSDQPRSFRRSPLKNAYYTKHGSWDNNAWRALNASFIHENKSGLNYPRANEVQAVILSILREENSKDPLWAKYAKMYGFEESRRALRLLQQSSLKWLSERPIEQQMARLSDTDFQAFVVRSHPQLLQSFVTMDSIRAWYIELSRQELFTNYPAWWGNEALRRLCTFKATYLIFSASATTMNFEHLHRNYAQRLELEQGILEVAHTKRNTQLRDYATQAGLTPVKLLNLTADSRKTLQGATLVQRNVRLLIKAASRQRRRANTAKKAKTALDKTLLVTKQAQLNLATATKRLQTPAASSRSSALKAERRKAHVRTAARENAVAAEALNLAFVKHARLDLKASTYAELEELTRFSTLTAKTNGNMYQKWLQGYQQANKQSTSIQAPLQHNEYDLKKSYILPFEAPRFSGLGNHKDTFDFALKNHYKRVMYSRFRRVGTFHFVSSALTHPEFSPRGGEHRDVTMLSARLESRRRLSRRLTKVSYLSKNWRRLVTHRRGRALTQQTFFKNTDTNTAGQRAGGTKRRFACSGLTVQAKEHWNGAINARLDRLRPSQKRNLELIRLAVNARFNGRRIKEITANVSARTLGAEQVYPPWMYTKWNKEDAKAPAESGPLYRKFEDDAETGKAWNIAGFELLVAQRTEPKSPTLTGSGEIIRTPRVLYRQSWAAHGYSTGGRKQRNVAKAISSLYQDQRREIEHTHVIDAVAKTTAERSDARAERVSQPLTYSWRKVNKYKPKPPIPRSMRQDMLMGLSLRNSPAGDDTKWASDTRRRRHLLWIRRCNPKKYTWILEEACKILGPYTKNVLDLNGADWLTKYVELLPTLNAQWSGDHHPTPVRAQALKVFSRRRSVDGALRVKNTIAINEALALNSFNSYTVDNRVLRAYHAWVHAHLVTNEQSVLENTRTALHLREKYAKLRKEREALHAKMLKPILEEKQFWEDRSTKFAALTKRVKRARALLLVALPKKISSEEHSRITSERLGWRDAAITALYAFKDAPLTHRKTAQNLQNQINKYNAKTATIKTVQSELGLRSLLPSLRRHLAKATKQDPYSLQIFTAFFKQLRALFILKAGRNKSSSARAAYLKAKAEMLADPIAKGIRAFQIYYTRTLPNNSKHLAAKIKLALPLAVQKQLTLELHKNTTWKLQHLRQKGKFLLSAAWTHRPQSPLKYNYAVPKADKTYGARRLIQKQFELDQLKKSTAVRLRNDVKRETVVKPLIFEMASLPLSAALPPLVVSSEEITERFRDLAEIGEARTTYFPKLISWLMKRNPPAKALSPEEMRQRIHATYWNVRFYLSQDATNARLYVRDEVEESLVKFREAVLEEAKGRFYDQESQNETLKKYQPLHVVEGTNYEFFAKLWMRNVLPRHYQLVLINEEQYEEFSFLPHQILEFNSNSHSRSRWGAKGVATEAAHEIELMKSLDPQTNIRTENALVATLRTPVDVRETYETRTRTAQEQQAEEFYASKRKRVEYRVRKKHFTRVNRVSCLAKQKIMSTRSFFPRRFSTFSQASDSLIIDRSLLDRRLNLEDVDAEFEDIFADKSIIKTDEEIEEEEIQKIKDKKLADDRDPRQVRRGEAHFAKMQVRHKARAVARGHSSKNLSLDEEPGDLSYRLVRAKSPRNRLFLQRKGSEINLLRSLYLLQKHKARLLAETTNLQTPTDTAIAFAFRASLSLGYTAKAEDSVVSRMRQQIPTRRAVNAVVVRAAIAAALPTPEPVRRIYYLKEYEIAKENASTEPHFTGAVNTSVQTLALRRSQDVNNLHLQIKEKRSILQYRRAAHRSTTITYEKQLMLPRHGNIHLRPALASHPKNNLMVTKYLIKLCADFDRHGAAWGKRLSQLKEFVKANGARLSPLAQRARRVRNAVEVSTGILTAALHASRSSLPPRRTVSTRNFFYSVGNDYRARMRYKSSQFQPEILRSHRNPGMQSRFALLNIATSKFHAPHKVVLNWVVQMHRLLVWNRWEAVNEEEFDLTTARIKTILWKESDEVFHRPGFRSAFTLYDSERKDASWLEAILLKRAVAQTQVLEYRRSRFPKDQKRTRRLQRFRKWIAPQTPVQGYANARYWVNLRTTIHRFSRGLFALTNTKAAQRRFMKIDKRKTDENSLSRQLQGLGNRLDVTVVLLRIAPSITLARKMLGLEILWVNDIPQNRPDYLLHPGDVITFNIDRIGRLVQPSRPARNWECRDALSLNIYTLKPFPKNYVYYPGLRMAVYLRIPAAGDLPANSRLNETMFEIFRLDTGVGVG